MLNIAIYLSSISFQLSTRAICVSNASELHSNSPPCNCVPNLIYAEFVAFKLNAFKQNVFYNGSFLGCRNFYCHFASIVISLYYMMRPKCILFHLITFLLLRKYNFFQQMLAPGYYHMECQTKEDCTKKNPKSFCHMFMCVDCLKENVACTQNGQCCDGTECIYGRCKKGAKKDPGIITVCLCVVLH